MQLKTFFRQKPDEAELAGAEEVGHARWRTASDAVRASYRSWAAAPSGERFLAHAAYVAALEREEDAARAYQYSVEQGRLATGRS